MLEQGCRAGPQPSALLSPAPCPSATSAPLSHLASHPHTAGPLSQPRLLPKAAGDKVEKEARLKTSEPGNRLDAKNPSRSRPEGVGIRMQKPCSHACRLEKLTLSKRRHALQHFKRESRVEAGMHSCRPWALRCHDLLGSGRPAHSHLANGFLHLHFWIPLGSGSLRR